MSEKSVRQEHREKAMAGTKKVRMCLKCKKDFLSRGPHNRICIPCGGTLDGLRIGGKLARGLAPSKPGQKAD